MKFFIKGIIRRIRYFLFSTVDKDVQRYISYFSEKDFLVQKIGNKYVIRINNNMGYFKENYEPEFSYNYLTNHFTVTINGITIKTLINPCYELICEWRGYNLLNSPSQGSIIVDAGAATGLITILYSKLIGAEGKVFALEPDDKMYSLLCYNLKINSIFNVVPIKKGLYSETGEFTFDSQTLSLVKSFGNDSHLIKTIDLKTLITQYSIEPQKVSVIKLDIEGAEIVIIDQIAEFLKQNPECLACIASYHKVENTPTSILMGEIIKNKYPELLVKNDFISHPTTFIYNKNKLMSN